MLKLENVSVAFPAPGPDRPAIANLDLTISDGEFVALMGQNGSGKSTLVRLFNGLVVPSSGRVEVDGLEITPAHHGHISAVRRRVGMVFQNPENQIVSTTVEREIAFGLENLGVPHAEMHRRVDAALAAFSLTAYRKSAPHELSAGEKQRLAIAAVLAMQPQHLIFDEPTSLLDLPHRRRLLQLVSALHGRQRRAGCGSMVLVTQFAAEALFADRLIILHRGRLLFDGPPKQIFLQESRLREAGLCPPIEFLAFLRLQRCKFPLTSVDDICLQPIL